MTSPIKKTKHRQSPDRQPLPIDSEEGITAPGSGINPEEKPSERTAELAIDQSIAARHLLYYPNEACLKVLTRCAAGVDSIMGRLTHTEDEIGNLEKDEILISMCTRLMADGGTGGIPGFDCALGDLVAMKNTKSADYHDALKSLASKCRANMSQITNAASIKSPDGANARQAILSFMGDLGSIEPKDTCLGKEYKGPLCDPSLVYKTYLAGLYELRSKIMPLPIQLTEDSMKAFEAQFETAKKATSLRGGGLSAHTHTPFKKKERAPEVWDLNQRLGLLNMGPNAEAKLMELHPDHKQRLVNASWPTYYISKEITQNVLEPVTGHVSSTFGDIVSTMNMLLGVPFERMTKEDPSGTLAAGPEGFWTGENLAAEIGALASAGLIVAGFHSAVEVYQPMCTFSTGSTAKILGPEAVDITKKQVAALRHYAHSLKDESRPQSFEHQGYKLKKKDLSLSHKRLLKKARSLEKAATKSVDMISLLQGEGGTLATIEVSRVLSNFSSDPKGVRELFSLKSRLEDLGQRGHTAELERARALEYSPNQNQLKQAIHLAEVASDHYAMLRAEVTQTASTSRTADEKAIQANYRAVKANQAVQDTTKALGDAVRTARAGWGLANPKTAIDAIEPLETARIQAIKEAKTANAEAATLTAAASNAHKQAKEAVRQVNLVQLQAKLARAEAIAESKESLAEKFQAKAVEKEKVLFDATKATEAAARQGWGSVTADSTRKNLEPLEETRKQAFKEAMAARAEANEARSESNCCKSKSN